MSATKKNVAIVRGRGAGRVLRRADPRRARRDRVDPTEPVPVELTDMRARS